MPELYLLDRSNPEFILYACNKGEPLDLRSFHPMEELVFRIAAIKPDGRVDDTPSVAFILVNELGQRYAAQITYETLKPLVQTLERITKG